MTSPRRYWHEMTSKEFAAMPVDEAIAVMPVAAVEQHGPHLPVWVDACLNQGILDHAVGLFPADLPALILPMLPVGRSNEHDAFAGTLSLSAETLIRLWMEVGESVHRAGIRKLLIFNSHGGQTEIAGIVARDLRVRYGMLVVGCGWFDFGLPDGLFSEDEEKHGIHGGAIETSMMLHLRPDLVTPHECRDFKSLGIEMEREFRFLAPTGAIAFGWQTQDLNPYGACGDARDADAERGRQVVEHAARSLVQLLLEMQRFPLDALRDRV